MAVAPEFPRISGSCSSTLLGGAIVGAAGGMRIDLIGRSPEDVDMAAIGFPAWDARGEAFVGVGNAAIVLFAVGILRRIRIGIAAAPEFLDELIALFVGSQTKEGVFFFFSDNVNRFFSEPDVAGRALLG